VWPDELLDREQWMLRKDGKKPWAPWADAPPDLLVGSYMSYKSVMTTPSPPVRILIARAERTTHDD